MTLTAASGGLIPTLLVFFLQDADWTVVAMAIFFPGNNAGILFVIFFLKFFDWAVVAAAMASLGNEIEDFFAWGTISAFNFSIMFKVYVSSEVSAALKLSTAKKSLPLPKDSVVFEPSRGELSLASTNENKWPLVFSSASRLSDLHSSSKFGPAAKTISTSAG